jgi:hypothetical protein
LAQGDSATARRSPTLAASRTNFERRAIQIHRSA